MPPRSPVNKLIAKLHEDLAELAKQARSAELTAPGRKKLNKEIERAATDLNELAIELDFIKRPETVFDPGNPRTIGFFIALALTAQARRPLADLQDFYGAGVYAIYYKGDLPLYAPISGAETPIYIGKSISSRENARIPKEQGKQLSKRLGEHRKNIIRAEETLDIADFDYRALVVQSGWEAGAEDYLIRLFKPIWNKETNIIYGIGKHGDSATTRSNKRSPWDTLHEGRNWAGAKELADKKSAPQIEAELKSHFAKIPAYNTVNDLVAGFISELHQF